MGRKRFTTEQTYYRLRREYGGLRMDQAKRLKEIEREITPLKKVVAEQALDIAILKEVADQNSEPGQTSLGGGDGDDCQRHPSFPQLWRLNIPHLSC